MNVERFKNNGNDPYFDELFDTTRNNVTMHLNNILEHELDRNSVCKDFLHTAEDWKKD